MALALIMAGCGQSDSDQVRAKVEQLAQATDHRQYRTICTEILAPSLVAHLVKFGISCPRAMLLALGEVHKPLVSVGKVIIKGSHAWAITLTTAQGQRAVLSAIGLRRTGQGWRIVALGKPVSAVTGG